MTRWWLFFLRDLVMKLVGKRRGFAFATRRIVD